MAKKTTLTYYVSPFGRDSWNGSSEKITGKDKDGPFASPAKARDALRSARKKGFDGAARIRVCPGVYEISEPLVLGAQDGGKPGAGVTWEAWGNGLPQIDGGRRIAGWAPLEKKVAGLPAVAVGKVWTAQVPKGWFFSKLHWDGKSLPRAASTTNDDWRSWPVCQHGSKCETQVKVKALPQDDASNAILNMMATPYTRWANLMTRVTRIDRKKKIIHHEFTPIHRPEKQKDIEWRLDNIISGIIEPGRWYLDAKAGVLYLWPPESDAAKTVSPDDHTIIAPWLSELLRIEGSAKRPVTNLRIAGLTFQHARLPDDGVLRGFNAAGGAIVIHNAEDCKIENCSFVRLEGNGVLGGPYLKRSIIRRCDVQHIGGGGISIRGECGVGEFVCAKNVISDNTIAHVGEIYRHSSGITVGAAERTKIIHNHVHDVPYIGIAVHGGPRHTVFRGWPRVEPNALELWKKYGDGEPTIDKVKVFIPGHNLVEKNFIHNVMQALDDGAAIYCHSGHHSMVRSNVVFSVESSQGMGLYFDDEEMDSTMNGNLVYRVPDNAVLDSDEAIGCHAAVLHLHHNGRAKVVNNVFSGGKQVLSIPNGYGGHVLEKNVFIWSGEPNYERAAPDPVNGPGDGRRQDGWIAGPSRASSNLWWHTKGAREAKKFLTAWQTTGYGEKSIAKNPKILDIEGFEVAEDSPIFATGFKPLAISDVGPRS